jgi:hypothetical protein
LAEDWRRLDERIDHLSRAPWPMEIGSTDTSPCDYKIEQTLLR